METAELGFERYFSLEEAASMLPWVRQSLETAHAEIRALQDEALLYARVAKARKSAGKKPLIQEGETLTSRYELLETLLQKWHDEFAARGILLRDIRSGLLDFPYHSERMGQDFLLCWKAGEDGVFYFHGISDGFRGRRPISLLPD